MMARIFVAWLAAAWCVVSGLTIIWLSTAWLDGAMLAAKRIVAVNPDAAWFAKIMLGAAWFVAFPMVVAGLSVAYFVVVALFYVAAKIAPDLASNLGGQKKNPGSQTAIRGE